MGIKFVVGTDDEIAGRTPFFHADNAIVSISHKTSVFMNLGGNGIFCAVFSKYYYALLNFLRDHTKL
jgi:hypothetical protein